METDAGLLESEAVLSSGGGEMRVEAALGSPRRPMNAGALADKLTALAGDRLHGALDDSARPASEFSRLGPARELGGASAGTRCMTGLLVGAAAMFATMYSTQAILPELGSEFDVSPAQTGLTISVVVIAVAAAAWVWGPLSDRYGRKRSLTLASALLVLPTLGTALAPSFGWFLFFRALQGLCMPG